MKDGEIATKMILSVLKQYPLERRHLDCPIYIYIIIYIYIYTRYEHEAIRLPKTENNIGAPSAPQKTECSTHVVQAQVQTCYGYGHGYAMATGLGVLW